MIRQNQIEKLMMHSKRLYLFFEMSVNENFDFSGLLLFALMKVVQDFPQA